MNDGRGPGRSTRLADGAVPVLALVTPFVGYLRFQNYPLWRGEVFLAVCGLLAAGLAIGLVIALRPRSLRPGIFVLLMVTAADLQYHFAVGVVSSPVKIAVAAGSFVAVGTIAWLLRDNLGTILSAALAVMLISAVVLPTDTIEEGAKIDRNLASRTDLPPILHIVLDELIGPAGIPTDIEGGPQLRAAIEEFHERFGLTLYTHAYSAFVETHYSLAALLNGDVEPPGPSVLEEDGLRFVVTQNEWFRQLAGAGYRIRVYESEYLEFCSAEISQLDHCYVYPVAAVGFLDALDIAASVKAALLVGYFVSGTIAGPLLPPLLPGPDDEPSKKVEDLPQLSSLPSLHLFERIADDLTHDARGTAYFVHALLPHYSYMFDRSCRLWGEPSEWLNVGVSSWLPDAHNTPATRERRYKRYFEQVRCVYGTLLRLFEHMRTLGLFDDAIIIVHGDHGSRISLAPYKELGRDGVRDRDIIDNASTPFAVRLAGESFGVSKRTTSIQRLFAERFLHESPEPKQDLLYLHGGEHALGLPYASRRMPRFPDER